MRRSDRDGAVLDRASHTGEDGEGDIRVTIRHIVEGRDGKLIEHNGKVTDRDWPKRVKHVNGDA